MTKEDFRKKINEFFDYMYCETYWDQYNDDIFEISDYDGHTLCLINFNTTEILCGYNMDIHIQENKEYNIEPPFVRDFLFHYLIRDLENDIEVDHKIQRTDEEMLKENKFTDIGDGSYYVYIDEYSDLKELENLYNFCIQIYNRIIQKGNALVREKCKEEKERYEQGSDYACEALTCSTCPYSQNASVFDSSDWNKDIRKIFFTELLKQDKDSIIIQDFCEYLWTCIHVAYKEYFNEVVESLNLFNYLDGTKAGRSYGE